MILLGIMRHWGKTFIINDQYKDWYCQMTAESPLKINIFLAPSRYQNIQNNTIYNNK